QNRRLGDLLHGFVVEDDAVPQDAVMAVIGERVERHIGDDADFRHRFLDRAGRSIDQIVRVENGGTGGVALRHVDIGEGGDRGDAEAGGAFGLLWQQVHGIAEYPGHRVDRLLAAFSLRKEDGPDQIVHRKAVFLYQPARPVRLAHAAQPAAAGDLVDAAYVEPRPIGPVHNLFSALRP